MLAAVVISQIPPLANWFLDVAAKIPVVKRFAPGLRDFYEGSAGLFQASFNGGGGDAGFPVPGWERGLACM